MVYFDNAATTYPKPQSIQFAVSDAVKSYGGNPGRSGHRVSMKVSEKVFEVRQKAAAFFDAEPENVIFTMNCTHALNMAIKGVMEDGGHIITSCLEHNSVLRPIYAMTQTGKVTYSVADVYENDDDRTLRSFANLIRPDTKAIACTYASNVSGTVLPIRKLSALCKQYGLVFIVDAAQAAGMLPISVKEMGIDILCTAGHKGLYGATGTGLMILNEGAKLGTIMEGGTGSNSLELEQPDFMPDRFESGTLNTVGILSLGAGLDFVSHRGIDEIYRYEMALCARVYNEMKQMPNVDLIAESFRLGRKAPIVSFNIKGVDSTAVTEYLSEKGYMLRGGFHCAALAHRYFGTAEQGAVRFSPGHFNKPQQINAFLNEITKIKKNGLS